MAFKGLLKVDARLRQGLNVISAFLFFFGNEACVRFWLLKQIEEWVCLALLTGQRYRSRLW